ncbi:MAG: hypothetical protein Hyperionvirus32_12 [Hyperionvirus sp.]|uniref:Uncharacterized protein n=1 Tax=Hyperionvirus sp. TaxID=2487770 RepID=A0A3G5ABQ1_9VIRU|nr:MAG: hypothetical protein Hyperionvirus32_12 [Hyperionvirus sp.]
MPSDDLKIRSGRKATLLELEILGWATGLFLGIVLNVLRMSEYIEIKEDMQDVDWMNDKTNYNRYVNSIIQLIFGNILLVFSLSSAVYFCSSLRYSNKIGETTESGLEEQAETTGVITPSAAEYGTFPAG